MDDCENIEEWKRNTLQDVEFMSREEFEELSRDFRAETV